MEKKIDFTTLLQAIQQSASSIIITDLSGTIQFANSKFLELTGYSEDETIGMNPRILKSGETPKETYAEMWGSIASGKAWRGEVRNRRKKWLTLLGESHSCTC